MKRYEVIVMPRAAQDLHDIHDYIAARSPLNARRFLSKLETAIESLADLAGSLSMAEEAEEVGRDVRHLVVYPYRILYMVKGSTAEVLTVRHGLRLPRL